MKTKENKRKKTITTVQNDTDIQNRPNIAYHANQRTLLDTIYLNTDIQISSSQMTGPINKCCGYLYIYIGRLLIWWI